VFCISHCSQIISMFLLLLCYNLLYPCLGFHVVVCQSDWPYTIDACYCVSFVFFEFKSHYLFRYVLLFLAHSLDVPSKFINIILISALWPLLCIKINLHEFTGPTHQAKVPCYFHCWNFTERKHK
jgi:hypothetical protein